MPDRPTPSEARKAMGTLRKTFIVWDDDDDARCLDTLERFVDEAAALVRPTPLPNPSLDRAREAAGELFAQLDPQKDPTLYVCAEDVVDFLSSLAQPASPPTQGWEEALRCLASYAKHWSDTCGVIEREPGRQRVESEIAKWEATLRSHLAGRETPQGWTREVPTEPGWYWYFRDGGGLGVMAMRAWAHSDGKRLFVGMHAIDVVDPGWWMRASVPLAPTSERSEP